MNHWPFEDPPDAAVYTTRRILDDGAWIAYVTHDLEDGAWQFHSADREASQQSDIRVVGLGTMLKIDPTLAQLADLPPGWEAWRNTRDSPWLRAKLTE